MITEATFKAACGHCGGHVEFGPDYLGGEITCPHPECGKPMLLVSAEATRAGRARRNKSWFDENQSAVVKGVVLVLGVWGVFAAASSGNGEIVMGFALIFLGAVIYFLPAVVAHQRKHPQALAISVLTLLAGWTFLGWLVALVWSCTSIERAKA